MPARVREVTISALLEMEVDNKGGSSAAGTSEVMRALSAQFATLSTIFDALSLGIYVADFDTYEILFVNAHTQSLFGTNWAGRRCYEYLQAGQKSPCSFCTNHLLVKDGKAQPPHLWEFQNTHDQRWYLCIDRAIPWVDGHLVRLEAAVDITDRKELERFREQYVGLVSHDLRGPLSAVALAAAGLEQSLRDKSLDREAEQLAQIRQTAKRVENMIRDLLESVRLESDAASSRREPVDLEDLARGVIEAFPVDERARVSLHVLSPSGRVLGDRAQLERVLDNLVANALKHSPPSAPVVIETRREGETVIVSVVDQGPGIAAEHQPHLFERFYRVPGTRTDGLGLGLYIAKAIVELHGGRISVESTPGRGSRFVVTLPIAPASPSA